MGDVREKKLKGRSRKLRSGPLGAREELRSWGQLACLRACVAPTDGLWNPSPLCVAHAAPSVLILP